MKYKLISDELNQSLKDHLKLTFSRAAKYLIDWDELVNDARFAFDGSVELNNQLFKNNDVPLTTRYNAERDGFSHVATYDFIKSGIGMYQITNDEIYLDQSRRTATYVDSFLLTDENLIFHYET